MRNIARTAAAALTVVAALAAPVTAQITTARVAGGEVSGVRADDIAVFKGIPFAAPPVGANRWRAPQPVKPWAGVLAADHQPAACMQDEKFVRAFGDTTPLSEDCLYLNVYTPAHKMGEKLPVMVWIYGGGFALGGTALYNGTNIAKKGVVFVSVAYRVGPLGFMGHPELTREGHGSSGNYGLRDQIAGLKWVKANIAKFGGDSQNVTIFGESAGGISVSMLAASPLAKGLFHKAISESGGNFGPAQHGDFNALKDASDLSANGGVFMRTRASAEHQGVALLNTLHVKTIAQARKLAASEIEAYVGPMGTFWPSFDGQVLIGDQYRLYQQGRYNDTPVLIGTNSDEGALFMPPRVAAVDYKNGIRKGYGRKAEAVLAAYPAADDAQAKRSSAGIFEETAFAWPTWAWARLQSARHKNPVYVYYFDHKTPWGPNGSWHGSEIKYVFDQLGPTPGPVPYAPPTADDHRIADAFITYWVNFARTGNPNGDDLPKWTPFSSANPRYMEIGDAPGMIDVPNLAKLKVWEDYYAWRRNGAVER